MSQPDMAHWLDSPEEGPTPSRMAASKPPRVLVFNYECAVMIVSTLGDPSDVHT